MKLKEKLLSEASKGDFFLIAKIIKKRSITYFRSLDKEGSKALQYLQKKVKFSIHYRAVNTWPGTISNLYREFIVFEHPKLQSLLLHLWETEVTYTTFQEKVYSLQLYQN